MASRLLRAVFGRGDPNQRQNGNAPPQGSSKVSPTVSRNDDECQGTPDRPSRREPTPANRPERPHKVPVHVEAHERNFRESILCSLRDETLLNIMRQASPATVQVLRSTCRQFLELFEEREFDHLRIGLRRPRGPGKPLPKLLCSRSCGCPEPFSGFKHRLFSPVEREELQAALERDMFCASCLDVRHSDEYALKLESLKSQLRCTACRRDHPALFFAEEQRELDQRTCIGRQGFVRLCEHSTLSLSDLDGKPQGLVPWRGGGGSQYYHCPAHEEHKIGGPEDVCRSPSLLITRRGHGMVELAFTWTGSYCKLGKDRGELNIVGTNGFRDFLLSGGCFGGCQWPGAAMKMPGFLRYEHKFSQGPDGEDTHVVEVELGPIVHRTKYPVKEATVWEHHKTACSTAMNKLSTYSSPGESRLGIRRSKRPVQLGFRYEREMKLSGAQMATQEAWLCHLDPDSYGLKSDEESKHVAWCDTPGCAANRQGQMMHRLLKRFAEDARNRPDVRSDATGPSQP